MIRLHRMESEWLSKPAISMDWKGVVMFVSVGYKYWNQTSQILRPVSEYYVSLR